ncbi:MAG: ParB/RepB/Spo0J family partition protein [Thermodesulfobacteriota bacterium]
MDWLACTRDLTIRLDQIDLDDRTYLVPCYDDLQSLLQSVRTVGIINPPVVQERPDRRFRPVLGRRRLTAALQAGIDSLRVLALAPKVPEREVYALAFWDNVAQRSLDKAATAYVVMRLLQLFPRDQAARDFFPALGIPAMGPKIDRLQAIGSLKDDVLERLALGRINEKTAALLALMKPAERQRLVKLAQDLGLNANKAEEVLGELFDLSVHSGREVAALLEEEQARRILENHELPVPEKATQFRALLHQWKFPEIAEREAEFHRRFTRLADRSGVSIRPTPSFEDERCTIQVDVDSWEHAEKLLALIKRQLW